MNPNTIRRLVALERLQKTFSPSCGSSKRSPEELAGLLCDYDHLWLSDGATLQSRNERYTRNLELVEQWRSTSLVEKLERYQELFNEI